MTSAQRKALAEAIARELIAGDTRTPRESVVGNAEALAAGDPDKALGLGFEGLDPREVMDAVASLCGCSADLAVREGPGFIDPERTLDELTAVAERLRLAAERGERVLLATGHPAGLLELYAGLAGALERAGARVATPRSGERLGKDPLGKSRTRLRYPLGVGCLTDGVSLLHTHESWPMELILDSITGDDSSAVDLVVADHGYAGAAIVRGLETLSITDVNDPALAVARARGMTQVMLPLDDNLNPEAYAPLARYLAGEIAGTS